MDYLMHSTTANGLYHILREGRMKTANVLGVRGTAGENKDVIYFTPISEEYMKFLASRPSRDFLIFLKPRILERYNTYFINTSNAFGPLSGRGSAGDCICKHTFYSTEFRKTHAPKFLDCYVETEENMKSILLKTFPPTEDIVEFCDGGPELGILPPGGIMDISDYIHSVKFPTKESLSAYTKSKIEKNIGLDTFYNVLGKSYTGVGGRRGSRKGRMRPKNRKTLKRK